MSDDANKEPGTRFYDPEEERQELISRDLDDVYLLIDHLSGRADRRMSDLFLDSDRSEALVQTISKIRYPPVPATVDKARDAANLLRARDILNQAAQPATGASIAFTILVAGGGKDATRGEASAGSDANENPKRSWMPRSDLAARAYPEYVLEAHRFRRFWRFVLTCLLWVLFLTSLLSWWASAGQFAMSQVSNLDARIADVRATIYNTETGMDPKVGTPTVNRVPTAETWQPPLYCRQNEQTLGDETRQERSCEPFEELELLHQSAVAVVSCFFTFRVLLGCSMKGSALAEMTTQTFDANNAAIERAGAVLSVVGNNILPTLYGFLGALVAVVRSIRLKTRESLLTPRDSPQMRAQMLLGAVIGACIGLFLSPSAAVGGSSSLTGSVTLTGSGLSFLAGFGADDAFCWVSNLVRALFGTGTTAVTPSAPPVRLT